MREVIERILSTLINKVYECARVEDCINQLAEELDNKLRRETNNRCYVGHYDSKEVEVICGLWAYYVELDYETTVRTKITKLDIVWVL
jgi:hypothetical protein